MIIFITEGSRLNLNVYKGDNVNVVQCVKGGKLCMTVSDVFQLKESQPPSLNDIPKVIHLYKPLLLVNYTCGLGR